LQSGLYVGKKIFTAVRRKNMKRSEYVIGAATIVGVFASIQGGLYDWIRNTFFPVMKSTSPVATAVIASIIPAVLGTATIMALGFFWFRFENKRKKNRIKIVKEWSQSEIDKLTQGMNRLGSEITVELEHFRACQRANVRYHWRRWEKLAEICALIKGTSDFCNIGRNKQIEQSLDAYPELWVIKAQRESVIQGVDRVLHLFNNRAAEEIGDIHKANVTIEDVRDTHIDQIQRFMSSDLAED
jgi:hypothetical protein